MPAKLNIDDLKNEYIGKVFGWLTVIDVLRLNNNWFFKCKCKCGAVKVINKKHVLRGSTVSCGCYQKSKEKADKYSKWCKYNPDKVKEKTEKARRYLKEHPELQIELGKQHSEWIKNDDNERYRLVNWHKENPELSAKASEKRSTWSKEHPELQKKINENIASSITEDERKRRSERRRLFYIEHQDEAVEMNMRISKTVSNIWKTNPEVFTRNIRPSSKYEQEIANFISTFYSGECIRNSHRVIAPLEVDLYYPEKKIAIEFNGDYWHDENHKPIDYHYNKFRLCYDIGIILVSIFELEWSKRESLIKQYLKDLFNGKENIISFNDDTSLMNNNYPTPNCTLSKLSDVITDYYNYDKRNIRVYTCGYSKLSKSLSI